MRLAALSVPLTEFNRGNLKRDVGGNERGRRRRARRGYALILTH